MEFLGRCNHSNGREQQFVDRSIELSPRTINYKIGLIWIYFAIIIEIEEKKKGGKEEEKYSTGVSASAKKIYSRNHAFSLIYVVVTRSLFQLSNFQRSIFLAVNDPYYRTIRNKIIVFQNYWSNLIRISNKSD